ncbi:PhlG protein [Colletotrichum navitas]|uniref:PhlG protein n=1 Tax=Colletotrichum navitas TaxID=681940 RepID=A0AAD8V6Q2_9PEZI|nr:PhlG protein [Colletotrichum navitas]KAK1593811.1 PhlG protein [Colletotrichum navitas]
MDPESLRQRSALRLSALRSQIASPTLTSNTIALNRLQNPDQDGYPAKVPIIYYPLETQKAFHHNRRRIKNKKYAKYFNQDLYIYADIPQYMRQQMPPDGVLPIKDCRRLLEPGYHRHENGWRALPDGTAYVTSRTRFPGSTGDMVRWWFWWHSVEPERYALWFPYDHLSVHSNYAHRLHRDDLSHTQKWLGSTHRVTEFIGATKMTVRIHFVDPAHYGLPWADLKEAGYEAAVCAELWDGLVANLKIGDFLHLWRKTEDGLELRSRYWLGGGVHYKLFGMKVGIDYLAGALGIKHRMAGENVAYEHFIHDQTEFTNLASFLPDLYADHLAGKL